MIQVALKECHHRPASETPFIFGDFLARVRIPCPPLYPPMFDMCILFYLRLHDVAERHSQSSAAFQIFSR